MRTSSLLTYAVLAIITILKPTHCLLAQEHLIDLSYSSTPPKIASKSNILINATSNTILAQKNAHEKLPPASLTKILSLYIVENHIKNGMAHLSDKVKISTKARHMEGSRMFLEANTYETLDNLIDGLIVTSGNDATIALAEYIAGSEERFVEIMNQTAQELGMLDSHFENATGLPDPQHYSTAYDLGLLAWHFQKNHSDVMPRMSKKWLTYHNIKQHNRNGLLWQDPDVTGMKTGFTNEAGYCLIASATKNHNHYISVVLGDKTEHSRNQSTSVLLQFAQRAYDHITFNKDPDIQSSKVWYSTVKSTKAVLQKPVSISIPKKTQNLEKKIAVNDNLFAPTTAHTIIGRYELYLDQNQLASIPLVTEKDLHPGSTFGSVRDWFQYQIESMIQAFFSA